MRKLVQLIARWYMGLGCRPLKRLMARLYRVVSSVRRRRTVIATIDGITYELDLNENIDSAVYYAGCFEPHVTRAIENLCREGMTALDVGANVGCHTLRLAKLVGSSGTVIAFEPAPWALSKLRRNVELNDFHNIVIESLAVSNENKENQEVTLSCSWPISTAGIDASRLHPLHHGYMTRVTVDFVTLDRYVETHDIPKIDLIKMDVDGYELRAIQGGVKTLKACTPVILMELQPWGLAEVGDNADDLVSLLLELGYKFYSEKTMKPFQSTDTLPQAALRGTIANVILSTTDL
jgi:FkbM family methyltransferase